MIELAIIGGTSLQSFGKLENLQRTIIPSAYGEASSSLQIGNRHGKRIAFLNRHGEASKIPPHKINYQANIDILHSVGVKKIIAVNAVGGISAFAGPLHISIPEQIIDYTYSREHTYFNGGEAGLNFIDFTSPFSNDLREKLISLAHDLRFHEKEAGLSSNSCYACTQGPRLETAAEIKRLAQDGCDIVGMTMMPEAALAREKNIEYASVCLVVNWAAGLMDKPITMLEIQGLVATGSENIEALLDKLIKDL